MWTLHSELQAQQLTGTAAFWSDRRPRFHLPPCLPRVGGRPGFHKRLSDFLHSNPFLPLPNRATD